MPNTTECPNCGGPLHVEGEPGHENKFCTCGWSEPCPTCGGEGKAYCHAARDGACSWEHCPQAKDYQAGCVLADWEHDEEETTPQPCPDCQQEPCPTCSDQLAPGVNPYFGFEPGVTEQDSSDCPDCQPKQAPNWETLVQRKCRTCGGSRKVEGRSDDHTYRYTDNCPDCRQDGRPTGLAFSELTFELYCPHDEGQTCERDGKRLLLTGDELTMAGERILDRLGTWSLVHNAQYSYASNGRLFKAQPTRQAALLAALWALEGA